MQTLTIGPLTLVGETAGAHMHITVLGTGTPGSRPLCGKLIVRVEEWEALVAAVNAPHELMRPVLSVLDNWDWPGIVKDGCFLGDYGSAIEAAAKALADVAIAQAKAQEPRVDDESRCAVCAWPLAESVKEGCVRGNCSLRPPPANKYAPERAEKELRDMLAKGPASAERCGDKSVWKGCARQKGHDGGHSTYDIDEIAKAKEQGR